MKRKIALLLASLLIVSLAACSQNGGSPSGASGQPQNAGEESAAEGDGSTDAPKQYTLNVSGIDGGITLFPVYLAQEMGWFEEAGLTINRSGFTNGPVQMEAIDTWDIGVTGIGGVLAGSISYDAVVIGKVGTDDGNQYMFVRPDSAVAAAGTGHNSISPEIVGSAESWKGMSVNCTYGTVLHYLLLKTMDGFGLTVDDIVVNWMDMPTSNASFLAGEGDAACVNGEVCFKEDKKDFVVASTGPIAQLGLMTNMVANPESLADPEKREAIKTFARVFYETTDWIKANQDEAVKYYVDWSAYAGSTISEEVALRNLTNDSYYSLQENYESLHTPASDGSGYNDMQEKLVSVLRFFIDCGSYQEGDDELFLQDKHFDTSIIDELYEELA